MDAHTAEGSPDYVHKCADKNTRFRWLDDWMLSDEGISSLGDLLQDKAGSLNYVVYPCGSRDLASQSFVGSIPRQQIKEEL